jgi:hypothetical protein
LVSWRATAIAREAGPNPTQTRSYAELLWREEVSEEMRVGVEMAGDATALGLELFSVRGDIVYVMLKGLQSKLMFPQPAVTTM